MEDAVYRRRSIGKAVAFLLCATMLCAPCAARTAYAPPETLRVGFFAFAGYHIEDADGRRSGYGYDLLQHLAAYGNWNYTYVGYDKSWAQMQEMLQRGEIDILSSAQKTPERMALFDFCDEPIGYSSAILTKKAGNDGLYIGEYAAWSGIRVGLVQGSSRNDGLAAFAAEKGFTYTPVYYEDAEEMSAALQQGEEIDAILTSNLRALQNEQIIAEFDTSPFYIMVRKGDAARLAQLNAALKRLFASEPGLRTQLQDQYYTPSGSDELAYTQEERDFVAAMRGHTFTAVMNPDYKPLSYFENGEPRGAFAQIALKIFSQTGLDIDIVDMGDRQTYLETVRERQADICIDTFYGYSNAENLGYKLANTNADVELSCLRLAGATGGIDTIAAVPDLGGDTDHAKALHTDAALVYYDTIEQAVSAVRTGKQDAAYLYTAVAEYAEYNDDTGRLITERAYGCQSPIVLGVNSEQNALLLSILNKAISSISAEDVAAALSARTAFPGKAMTVRRFVYENPMVAMGILLLVCLVCLLLVVFINSNSRYAYEHSRMEEERKRNEVLQEALRAAKIAVTSKAEFLSRVSHEMRTPLNAILGYMKLAESSSAPLETQKNCLAKSRTAAEQLLSIINEVLEASALESGKANLLMEPFDLQQELTKLSDLFDGQARAKNIDFTLQTVGLVEKNLCGDAQRLAHILTNLLSNAVKFTPEGGKVTLRAERISRKGDVVYLRFVVQDTGIGMSEAFLQRVGTPFEQESAANSRKYGGTGLGMSIVKMLTSLMSGSIKVESAQGVGTTVTLDIPFTAEDAPPQAYAADAPASTEADFDFTGRHILLVEDNPSNMEIASLLLTETGAEVTCAANGRIALERYQASPEGGFDMILMDVQMPEMDGYQTTRAIRASGRRDAAAVPIFAMTANAFEDDVAASLTAGMNEHISKPIDFQALFSMLRQWFAKSPA
ncbi:MAG: transporter substrate-binding domain-containing protein [Clostridia bacterium]|nr:transporter substrate-binding domain-containing protein [Clostridia bacterium]